jgi:chromosome segregation ATPase
MSSLDQLKQRMDDLTSRFSTVGKKRSEHRGQLEAKKEELVSLKREIEAAGFDPKNLRKERDKLEVELISLMDTFEKELAEVETALAGFDKK